MASASREDATPGGRHAFLFAYGGDKWNLPQGNV
jgi:hypothetical protein